MRYILSIGLLMLVASAGAQTFPTSRQKLADVQLKDSSVQKKWFVSKYSGLSASYMAFKGGSASVFSAPMGIQLNRMLNNNVFAFAGVEIAPSFITFNQRFMNNATNKTAFSNAFMAGNRNRFTVNPAAYVGIGYTNDNRTFQIEGRISLQQSDYFTDPSAFGSFMHLDRQLRGIPAK